MTLSHRPTKILITGRSGTGKSTYWTRFLLGCQAKVKFVFDHEGELAFRLGVPAAFTPDQMAEAAASGWVIYDPSGMFPGRLDAGFNFFCDFTFQAAHKLGGRKLLACDELQKLVGTNQVSAELAAVIEAGRRASLDAVMIAQQPNLIHNRIRNQLTEVVTFAQMDKNAVDWLEQAGFNANEVRILPPGAFIARNLNTGGQSAGKVF